MSLKLFYCYAREDKSLRDALGVRLGNLKRQELIIDWHDRNINAGQEWATEIDTNLNEADIILLLISPDFVHSDYCYSVEMKRALERHENGAARVIPIILRHGDYVGAPFSNIQALPTDNVPVVDKKWRRDEALFNVVQGIRKIVGELLCNEWLSKGNEYYLRKQYQEALEAYERAIYFNPESAFAYIGQGRTLNDISIGDVMNRDYNSAIESFTQAIKLDPKNDDAYVGKGLALFLNSWSDEDKDLVLEAFAQALRLNAKNEIAYQHQGYAFMSYSMYEDALTSFERAISVAVIPNRAVYKGKGDALSKLEQYQEAVEAYNICIKEGLKGADMYMSMGIAFSNLGEYKKALDAYEKVFALGVNVGQAYLERGNVLYQLASYQEALIAYENAINSLPAYKTSLLAKAYRGKVMIWNLLSEEASEKANELDPPSEAPDDSLGDLDDHPF